MFTYQLQIYPLEEVQYVAIYPGSGIIGNNKNSPEWWDVRLYTSDIYINTTAGWLFWRNLSLRNTQTKYINQHDVLWYTVVKAIQRGDGVHSVAGQQIRFNIESFQNAIFLISQPNPMMWPLIGIVSNQTLWCDHSLESSRRDDFNEGHNLGFGWEIRKLSWKPFCSLFLNCSPGVV